MQLVLVCAVTAVWLAANLYLWAVTQSHLTLFLQSLGMAGLMYPAMFWYVMRRR